jgi:post-segregation antitoxin (ccd killing protein)
MIRPIRRPDMDKVRLEIAIDRDLADHAEQHGLDVSAEAERGLRRRLSRAPRPSADERATILLQIERYNQHAEQHGLFADRWRRF